MSWTLVVNTFAGTLGALSIGYLAWAVWIFVRGLPTNGRVPNQRPVRRKSPWTPHYSR
ncbi:MAG: hypothetical protein LJE97_03165 [Betaproteobacteria bacterium]|nr:hypothetical protein [Betaproteobacteria bacterium]